MSILTEESPMPFGVHKGKKMKDVPARYLLYLYEASTYTKEVGVYIRNNLNELERKREL